MLECKHDKCCISLEYVKNKSCIVELISTEAKIHFIPAYDIDEKARLISNSCPLHVVGGNHSNLKPFDKKKLETRSKLRVTFEINNFTSKFLSN